MGLGLREGFFQRLQGFRVSVLRPYRVCRQRALSTVPERALEEQAR